MLYLTHWKMEFAPYARFIAPSIIAAPIPNYFRKHHIPPTFVKAAEIQLKESLGHGTAAGVAGANKEHMLRVGHH